MDVSSLLGALTGTGSSGGVQIEIRLHPPANVTKDQVVPMEHTPSWRLHKNPFWRVKHPSGSSNLFRSPAQVAPNQPYPPPTTANAPPQPPNYPYNNYPYAQQPQMPPGVPNPYGYQQPQQPYGAVGPSMMDPYAQQQQQQQQMYGVGGSGKEMIFAYEASQDVEGVVILRLPPSGKKAEHMGIKVQFIGRIDMSMGIHEGRPHYDFVSLSKELSPPSVLYQHETILPFRFKNMDKELESYKGRNASVRYIIKVLMERKFLPPVVKEKDVWVQLLGSPPNTDEAIKMEVGIEDCLHIEFEYDRRHYHLQDTIRGKIHFLLVRIKIKHMELAVIRRETSGEGVAIAAAAAEGPTNTTAVDASNIFTETQTLVKYEIMDGAPVKGEVIPVKLCLKGIPADLTPTYSANNNRFSVRYFLNLVLVDEDDRRYFKQQEIILWRKELG